MINGRAFGWLRQDYRENKDFKNPWEIKYWKGWNGRKWLDQENVSIVPIQNENSKKINASSNFL